jgi:hypothetical protein
MADLGRHVVLGCDRQVAERLLFADDDDVFGWLLEGSLQGFRCWIAF